MSPGYFTLVLHSHLPWVLHHGRWPHGVDWLNEVAAETYLPLWRALHAHANRGGSLGVALGLSPVLCEQLAHPDFHLEFVQYLDQKIAAARADRATFTAAGDDAMTALAGEWESFYRATLEDFMGPHGPNLVARFRRLEEAGAIEIVTCAATHGYLPLLSSDVAAERQVRVASASHRRHFGRAPRGIWLPECAYRPAGPWPSRAIAEAGGLEREVVERVGVEEILARYDLRYFFVDTHLLSGGKPLGVYADRFEALRHLAREDAAPTAVDRPPYHPHRVGVAARLQCFARDPVTAVQVWSGERGYPGDGDYLDFHKKRFPGGHRYWRVTHPLADLGDKEVYRPSAARARVPEHAAHFLALLARTLGDAAPGIADEPPIACAMFDTELFGHWWFEGTGFLAEVIGRTPQGVQPIAPSEYLDRHPARDVVALPEGSWGDGGGHKVWLNDATRHTWDAVHAAEKRFETLARVATRQATDPLLGRLMAQAGREVLLLEASDWQFLVTTLAARDYAEARLARHAADFDRLASLAERRTSGGALSEVDVDFLADCERRDSVFPDFDWRALPNPEPATTG